MRFCSLLEHFDPNRSEGDFVSVVLEAEMTFGLFGKTGPLGELGGRKFGAPLITVHVEVRGGVAVEKEGQARALDEDAAFVPLADFLGPFRVAVDEAVERSGHAFGFGLVRVGFRRPGIEELVFGAGFVGGAVGLGHAPHHARVSFGADLPLPAEIEILVLFGSDEIPAALFREGDGTVLNDPLLIGLLFLVSSPAVEGFAIEEESEAILLLVGAQLVRFGSEERQAGGEEKSKECFHNDRESSAERGGGRQIRPEKEKKKLTDRSGGY